MGELVTFGVELDNVVILDIDLVPPHGMAVVSDGNGRHKFHYLFEHARNQAHDIGTRFRLGNCLVVLSSVVYGDHGQMAGLVRDSRWNDVPVCSFHLVYDRMCTSKEVAKILQRLSDEGRIDPLIGEITDPSKVDIPRLPASRMSPKAGEGFIPFPIMFVECPYPRLRQYNAAGGLKEWLRTWKHAVRYVYPQGGGN